MANLLEQKDKERLTIGQESEAAEGIDFLLQATNDSIGSTHQTQLINRLGRNLRIL